MPFHNRYVVVAVNKNGKQFAVLSASLTWIKSLPDAVCFPSQQDANEFIAKNNVADDSATKTSELKNFDHVQSVFITAEVNDPVASKHVPEDVISFAGIFG